MDEDLSMGELIEWECPKCGEENYADYDVEFLVCEYCDCMFDASELLGEWE